MLSAFSEISATLETGKYSVQFRGQEIPIYSARSSPRDLAGLNAALDATAPGHTLVVVAPYAAALADIFKSENKFIFLSPLSFTEEIPADRRLIADDAALESFINSVDPNDKFSISLIPQWRSAGDYVASTTRGLFERAAIRLKTIGHFSKLWQINFRLNAPRAARYGDISALKKQPDALVMAGPSLDAHLTSLGREQLLWCADTALPALAARGIFPVVVFSVDAGFASREHFANVREAWRHATLVTDLTAYAAVQRLPFAQVLSYASSHPLVQEFCATQRPDLTPLENPAGDVGSLMRAVYAKLFGNSDVKILGHDGGHMNYITHARGTAYYRRSFAGCTRLHNAETYMLRLSRRYGKAAARSS